jgi:tRNA pseudouridine38-40 synthase
MTRIALGVSYDGRPWQGWQKQPHRRTVQDCLEEAIERFVRVQINTICAGRTDTGVHATSQVIHLDCEVERTEASWVRGLNALLPSSIAIQWAQRVDDSFHARFSATERSYTYVLLNSHVRQPLWAGRAGWVFQPLDIELMRQAATFLLGEHDFSSFRSSQCQAKSPVRTLHAIDLSAVGRFITVSLRANAFLHHMVRNIMGALIQVGQRREPVTYTQHLLEVCDRRQGAATFCPDGLYLTGVRYSGYMFPQTDSPCLVLTT